MRPAPDQWFTFKPMWPATDAEATALEARAAAIMAEASADPARESGGAPPDEPAAS